MCYGEKESFDALVLEVQHLRKFFEQMHIEQRKIPQYVTESFSDNNSTSIYVKPRTNNLECIKTIYCYLQYVGASGFGTLTVGDLSVPVPQGWSTFENMNLMLQTTAKRQLASGSATPGTMTLLLFGEDLADKGRW